MKRLTASKLLLPLCCFSLLAASAIAQTPSTTDSPVKDAVLELKDFSLYINRQPVAENVGSFGGTVVWFYLPDQGQFIISTNPHKGYDFQKVGTIAGNSISFWHKENYYEWISRMQVLSEGSEKEVWLMVDTGYSPKDCGGGVCFGSATPFERFIKNR